MTMRFFGFLISPQEIIDSIGGVKSFGVRTIALAEFARRQGFEVWCYSYNKKMAKGKAQIKKPSKSDIIAFLKKGLPVIVSVRHFLLADSEPTQMGHFIVITKYEKHVVWFNDPEDGKRHKLSEESFLFAWYNNVIQSSAYLLVIKPIH